MSGEKQEQQFGASKAEQAQRWKFELDASRKALASWHDLARTIDKRFRDEREGDEKRGKRLNLFTSNVQTQRALLYGQTPKVSVDRRFADAADDVARVASEILERLLNTDIEREDDSYATALQHALDDRLLPGFGIARVRYVVDIEEKVTPAIPGPNGVNLAEEVHEDVKTREDVETDYVHWEDFLWSAGARTWDEARWVGFRAKLGRAALVKRFGEQVGRAIPLNTAKPKDDSDAKKDDPWGRADVWEVWSKEDRKVYWYVDGYAEVLDEKDDPLELAGFWPCPRPMLANVTTSSMVPRPDYVLAQDLYEEIDILTTRIGLLEKAVRVVGAYNKASAEVKRMLSEARSVGNEMIPVENWAMFAEGGGIRGQVDWFPLEQVVAAIATLSERRAEQIDLLYQVTGQSDLMRGQATSAGATATEQSIKSRFGSVRIQALQDDFARFASELQRKKAEIIAKRFDATTILQRCNCANTPDATLAPQAVELLKSRFAEYRIEVKPEAVSMQDFASLKAERTETLIALSTFFQNAAPIMAGVPGSMPFLLEIAQWTMAGVRGASQIEGIFDRAIDAAKKAAAMPQQAAAPDPKVISQQMKGQQDIAKVQAELQADLVRTQAEVQADSQREQNQAVWNVREANAKAQISARTQAMRPKPGSGL